MKLSKIDLSSIIAIRHDDQNLGLILDREDSLEFVEIPAPLAAYEGLRQLDAIVTEATSTHPLMLPVQSSMADAVGYDPHQGILQVQFKNGSVYQYEDVDEDIWHEVQETDSLGRFFNQEIRGNYRSRRLNS